MKNLGHGIMLTIIIIFLMASGCFSSPQAPTLAPTIQPTAGTTSTPEVTPAATPAPTPYVAPDALVGEWLGVKGNVGYKMVIFANGTYEFTSLPDNPEPYYEPGVWQSTGNNTYTTQGKKAGTNKNNVTPYDGKVLDYILDGNTLVEPANIYGDNYIRA